MSHKRKNVLIVLTLSALFLLLTMCYKYEYSMHKGEAYEVNALHLNDQLVIVTQGSEL